MNLYDDALAAFSADPTAEPETPTPRPSAGAVGIGVGGPITPPMSPIEQARAWLNPNRPPSSTSNHHITNTFRSNS